MNIFQYLVSNNRGMTQARNWWWGLMALLVAATLPASAAEPPDYPDADTEKPCTSSGESPECAAKTFWLCSEKSIATCKLVGLTVQADGSQHKGDGTLIGDAWTRPWTLTWTELLEVTHANYTVWQIEGLREVVPGRLKGVPLSRRSLTGSHEMMVKMVSATGVEERQSVFLVEKKGVWTATGFAKWRKGERVSACDKRKLGSLACRYTVPSLAPW